MPIIEFTLQYTKELGKSPNSNKPFKYMQGRKLITMTHIGTHTYHL